LQLCSVSVPADATDIAGVPAAGILTVFYSLMLSLLLASLQLLAFLLLPAALLIMVSIF
jgi:hypothetical protein